MVKCWLAKVTFCTPPEALALMAPSRSGLWSARRTGTDGRLNSAERLATSAVAYPTTDRTAERVAVLHFGPAAAPSWRSVDPNALTCRRRCVRVTVFGSRCSPVIVWCAVGGSLPARRSSRSRTSTLTVGRGGERPTPQDSTAPPRSPYIEIEHLAQMPPNLRSRQPNVNGRLAG